jgi:hypothetical protein
MALHFVSARIRPAMLNLGLATMMGSLCFPVAAAHAAQFVVADATYTHSAQTTTDSHYRVNPAAGTPANWTSPVDYANGSAHVRLEVKTKPNTTTQTCFQVCFEATQNYGCTDISKPYTTTGVYEWDTPFSRFFTPGPVPWERGILKVALLLKDTKNVKPAPENVGAATSALYMPTDVRVTVTIISSGSIFQPPAGTPPTIGADAGLGGEPVDAGARDGRGAANGGGGAGGGATTGLADAGSAPNPTTPSGSGGSTLVQPPAQTGGSSGTSAPGAGQNPIPPGSNPGAGTPDAGSPAAPGGGGVAAASSGSGCSVAGENGNHAAPGLGGLGCVIALAGMAGLRGHRRRARARD